MKSPVNYFRYVISNRLGTLQVDPLGESNFAIQWDRQDSGELDYDKKLPSKITFTGAAYQNLLKLEQSIYRCDYVTITVERRCTAGGVETWIPWHNGRFSLNDGNWDLDGCQVELKLDDVKEDKCYNENKTKEIDLFQLIPIRRTVLLSDPSVEIETVTYSRTVPKDTGDCGNQAWGGVGDPFAAGWIIYRYSTIIDDGLNTCVMETRWAREVKEVVCGNGAPGPEWILISNTCPGGMEKYARSARTYGCVRDASNFGEQPFYETYECKILGGDVEIGSIDNGLSLTDVVDAFMDSFCVPLTFVSNFFQINPDVVSNINYVTGQLSKTRFITVFQKSDVKRPNVSGNATILKVTFENLFNILIRMFNLRWRIENGILRMEHVSYFNKTTGFDLTQAKYSRQMSGKRKYTYQTDEIPSREEFKFMEASAGDFQGLPIIYSGGCVTSSSRDNIKTITVDKVTTDVELCLSNPDPDSKVVDMDGLVLMACDYNGADYYLITESPIFGGASLNNSLAWAQLHRDYYKFDRPLRIGNLNGVDTVFFSVKPTKKGEQITITLCCDDVFDPDQTILTPLGTGIVDKANFNFKDETLELELLYPADYGLSGNSLPVAVNDVRTTYLNLPVTINVLANDTDADSGAILAGVEISGFPNHGSVVVNPDQSITYTPEVGFVGNDLFLYRFHDEWGEFSNNGLVTVNVFANSAPNAVDDAFDAFLNTVITIPAPGVFANDVDDNGYTLDTFDPVSIQGGTVAINIDGSLIFTPASGFVGTDSFTYRIKDTLGLTDTATVTITVRNPSNPIAVDDPGYTTGLNINLVVAAPGVLANDTTTIGTLTAIAGTFATAHGGSVVVAANGGFNYTPPTGYSGNDSFTYTVSNGTGTDTGTVSINVIPNIFVKLQKVNDTFYGINRVCDGASAPAGTGNSAIFTLFFYSDAGGTTPLDVSFFNLIVNLRITGSYYSDPGTYTHDFAQDPVFGTQQTLFSGSQYEYFRMETDCFGGVTYTNENITLRPGAYTII